ncbi:hypothetical protein CTEN210_07013 [Chaetoceros tenuissimus]|uniref:Uncharacterized protein n=1 Tax=Chaetoceros tenuissimus TaxID=426638 RepID=A0AAD3H4Q6_9STRA|nr:hypothetical protein CTEN210_07013 [Chaetoceros tenuissimus]
MAAMCLLIKDENEKLPEWLAYHYLKLPLQYLVVRVDSESTTSPKYILDKFRNETGMDIVLWNDAHFRLEIDTSTVDPIQQHRIRQRRFFSECMKHQKARGRKWLIMIDTDEYIANNVYGGHEPVLSDNQTLLDYINRKENEISTSTAIDNTNTSFIQGGCHLMSRLTFSAVDEKDASLLHRKLPGRQFKPMMFNTLRFFRHASPNAGKDNAREDARRTRAKFNKKGLLDYGKPIYHMQGWLNEFVDRRGLSQSQDLLRDVGVIKVGKQKIRESPYYPRISDFEKLDENIPVEKRYFGVNGEILPTNA